jgi:tRNA pseudouridine13 synthase
MDRKDFLTATLVKEGLSTHEALGILSRENHLALTMFGYLGNKDRNAVTSQRISVFKAAPERIKTSYPKMFLRDLAYSDNQCKIGALKGNHFTIRVRDFNGFERLGGFIEEAKEGIPNFYGPQHFGASGLNIKISESIIRRDFKDAVIKFVFDERDESEKFAESRLRLRDAFLKWLKEDTDINRPYAEEVLSSTPGFLRAEKNMLFHLLENRHDYIGALRLVPKFLRLLILQAFQSYNFNLLLSGMIAKGELPDELPTIGYDIQRTKYSDEAMAIAERLGVNDMALLEIKEMPEVSLKSFNRPARIYPKNLEYRMDGKDLILSFDLDKGAYATVLIFEMFKHF